MSRYPDVPRSRLWHHRMYQRTFNGPGSSTWSQGYWRRVWQHRRHWRFSHRRVWRSRASHPYMKRRWGP